MDIDGILASAHKVTSVSMTLDLDRMRSDGKTLDPADFSVEKFDEMVQSRRKEIGAESFSHTLSGLTFKGKRLEGNLKMVATEEGIDFEGLEDFLTQNYALSVPDRKSEAGTAARKHLADPEKREMVLKQVKYLFWKHTPIFG